MFLTRQKIVIIHPLHIQEHYIRAGWHGEIIRQGDNGLGDLLFEILLQEKPISVLLREQEFIIQDDAERS